jgi:hypothetical protein
MTPAMAAGVTTRLMDMSDLVAMLVDSESENAALFKSVVCLIDAPTGQTKIKCEGCEFFTWVDGKARERQQVVDIDCANGPCWEVVGAIVSTQPVLLAQADATH